MKKFKFFLDYIKNSFISDKFISSILIIGLCISYLSLFYLYGFYSGKKIQQEKYDYRDKKYSLELVKITSDSQKLRYINHFTNNKSDFPPLFSIKLMGKSNESEKIITSYFPENTERYIVQGKYFTDIDSLSKGNGIIVDANYKNNSQNTNKLSIIGSKIDIDGKEFNIVGVNALLEKGAVEIDYDTFMKNKYNVDKIEIIFQKKLGSKQETEFINLSKSILGADIVLPPKVNSVSLSLFLIRLAVSIGMISLLVINIIFLFKYKIEKKRREYMILRIYGASKRKIIGLILLEICSLNIFAFLLSTSIFYPLKTFIISNLNIPFSLIYIEYLIVFIIILFISIISIIGTSIYIAYNSLANYSR